jgi:apolipoprotein N-acyltransferase
MKLPEIRGNLPSLPSILLAIAAAVLLVLAFPDSEYWYLAWFALVPLLWSIDREKGSIARSLMLGWLFGTAFFFGTCWWLTFAPITYAGFPPALAYFLLLAFCSIAAIFPAIFAGVMAFLLQRSGAIAILAAPFVWVCMEFARYWITGNNWNAIGYSQAFGKHLLPFANYGGVLLVGFVCAAFSAALVFAATRRKPSAKGLLGAFTPLILWFATVYSVGFIESSIRRLQKGDLTATLVAIQPNVPMSGLSLEKWRELRLRHVQLAEAALATIDEQRLASGEESGPGKWPTTTVVFPESPMNFQYTEDREFQSFINDFARRNDVSVLFNSAEPNHADGKYFNSAVIVGSDGRMLGQYDKIYLVPFGESVPAPLQSIVPAFVGSFSIGNEYDLLPVGDVKAGVMICFESHFGQLSRQYVANGADVIIEMTNDGYLGPTPVLRQHLANAVLRAVETNRPVLRVTNVGITAYINERGEVLDAADSYVEATRIWSVAKSDGSQTFYVKYGDWFAWLCTLVTLGLVVNAFLRRRQRSV